MTVHADARAVLGRWPAPTPAQNALRAAFADFLDTHPDGADRSCRVAHVTASALLVDPASRSVLLTLHGVVGRWLQLGGHCEPADATLAAAALRETLEESGLPADAVTIDAEPVHLDRHHVRCRFEGVVSELEHLDVQYLATASAAAAQGPTPDRTAWFAWDAPPPGLDAAVVALIDAARSRWS